MEAVKEESGTGTDLIILGKEQRLPSTVEVTVFRLIQEAVNNARKHANAQHIMVRLEFAHNQINMQVQDDGVGFDLETARRRAREGGSFGLMSMEERVDLLGGSLRIESTPGDGTSVSASVPVDSTE